MLLVVVAFVLLGTSVIGENGSSKACSDGLAGPTSLDLRRWTVRSQPSMSNSRDAFGRYSFSVSSSSSEEYTIRFAMVEGVPWPHPISRKTYRDCRQRMRLRPGDAVVATYPKSGTTWVEQIVLLLVHGSRAAERLDPTERNSYSKRTKIGKVWLEPSCGKRSFDFDSLPSPRVVKSHAPFTMLMGISSDDDHHRNQLASIESSGARIIYVARNAKDAAVSLYYQRAPVKENNTRMPMDAWCALYLEGTMSCGSYFDHVATWYAASKKSKSILFVRYEDVKLRPIETIASIAKHLGLDRPDSEIRAVHNASTFEAMSSMATAVSKRKGRGRRRDSSDTRRYSIAPPGSSPQVVGAAAAGHLRQGKRGSWRALFNDKLNSQFDSVYAERMKSASRRAAWRFDDDDDPTPPAFDFGCENIAR